MTDESFLSASSQISMQATTPVVFGGFARSCGGGSSSYKPEEGAVVLLLPLPAAWGYEKMVVGVTHPTRRPTTTLTIRLQ
jgi:hypothetical protein